MVVKRGIGQKMLGADETQVCADTSSHASKTQAAFTRSSELSWCLPSPLEGPECKNQVDPISRPARAFSPSAIRLVSNPQKP